MDKTQLCTTCYMHTDKPCATVSQAYACWRFAIYNQKNDDDGE